MSHHDNKAQQHTHKIGEKKELTPRYTKPRGPKLNMPWTCIRGSSTRFFFFSCRCVYVCAPQFSLDMGFSENKQSYLLFHLQQQAKTQQSAIIDTELHTEANQSIVLGPLCTSHCPSLHKVPRTSFFCWAISRNPSNTVSWAETHLQRIWDQSIMHRLHFLLSCKPCV